jgi:RES domain-containing protein
MLVYRVGNGAFARDLTGEGARLFGGRWNQTGIPCLYTSSSRALSVLEYSVNVNLGRILRNLTITTIEIPEDDIRVLAISELPGDWRNAPAPSSTKDFGTKLLRTDNQFLIRIPSTVIPEEFNYLINPRHSRVSECRILEVKDFVYDLRIKTA